MPIEFLHGRPLSLIDTIEKGLIVDHPFDRLALTMHGRAVLKAMLPEL